MATRTTVSSAIAGHASPRPPPPPDRSLLRWCRQHFFGSAGNTLLTLLASALVIASLPPLLRWAVLDAVWWTDDPRLCRAAMGACWAVVAEKHRVILFGTFPYDEHWRGALVIALVVVMAFISAFRRCRSYWLFAAWLIAAAAALLLMLGGVFGLSSIGTHQWGGLPLTLLLFVGTVVGGLPTAILLALGRRSSLPIFKALAVAFVEIVRGVPLITVLFLASLVFPLFMPEGATIDKYIRAQVGMILFFAAYAAEVVRGGLQAIPIGQYEASDSLGLGYWQKTSIIILPQALRIVLPALMNDVIRAFKNTTFVSIIGLFDVLRATSTAMQDPLWAPFTIEAYLFIFLLYFAFCFAMSKYSEHLERDLAKDRNY